MTRKAPSSPVHVTYDEDADAVAFELIPTGKTATTLEIRPDLFIDLDSSGAVLAIEVLQASAKYTAQALKRFPAPGPMMTLIEAARVLGLSPATIRKQIHNHRVPATKLGRDWFVSKQDLRAYEVSRSPRGRRATTGAA